MPLVLDGKLVSAIVGLCDIDDASCLISLTVGGIVAAYSFLAQDAPKYRTGFSICLSFVCLSMFSCGLYFLHITWLNRQRDRGGEGSDLSWEDKRKLGDLSPDYRYLR